MAAHSPVHGTLGPDQPCPPILHSLLLFSRVLLEEKPGSVGLPLAARWGLERTQETGPCIWVLFEGGVSQPLSLPQATLLTAYSTGTVSRASLSPPAIQVQCFPAQCLQPWGSSITKHRGSGLREGRLTVPLTLAGETAPWTRRGW